MHPTIQSKVYLKNINFILLNEAFSLIFYTSRYLLFSTQQKMCLVDKINVLTNIVARLTPILQMHRTLRIVIELLTL